ncbi:hypothetical protein PGT21_007101 [Puccinia graminis f. sp. tritici]|uniref:Uncharacterized protein n=1 Tax=Puccinia graminis f. sp. tritici TaxID=56615 RepID=A0A5B0QSQ3_PUCGR|nr:hypothetical protein PGT21_007101 [Puccinia graminis f. sp. tritici]
MTTTKLPLPHFLNLPLPPIPFDPSSSSSKPATATTTTTTTNQPLVFKLNLSPEQYDELLNLDAEVEEGEEGGLRVEFDPSGKAALHLNPNRILQLNPPRSGPSRTNRPEEIYRHTPASTPSSTRSPLTGLFRIPTSTTVYDLQRSQPPSDLAIAPSSTQTRPIEPTKQPSSKPSNHTPTNHTPQPPRPSRVTTDSGRSERERLAGQRLKEKRMEDDRKKKEKQMVILPDAPSTVPATRKTRPTKSKVPNKQISSISNRQPPSTVSSNASLSSSRNPPPSVAPASQSLPLRRSLPGSQAGKQLAHGMNQHLTNPSAALLKSTPSQSQSEALSPPQPVPAPAPPPVAFKPSSSSRRGKPATLNQPALSDSKSAPPSEPPSATKLSTSTGLTSLSEEGEADQQRLVDTPSSHPVKRPSPPVAPLKPKDSPQPFKSSPRVNAAPNEVKTHSSQSSLPEANAILPERPSSATSVHKRPVRKQAAAPAPQTSASPQVESARSLPDADITHNSSKRPRPDILAPNPPRPKKTQRRDGNERRPVDNQPAPPTQLNRVPSNNGAARPEEPVRKSGVTVKKITVPAVNDRNPAVAANRHEATPAPPISKKRALDAEPVAPSNQLTKRVRQEEGGLGSASNLPPIRKVVRPPPVVPLEAENTQNGQAKRIKKKKRTKRVDYTSSEVEEGEEPGEIVNTSSRTRPSLPASTSSHQQAPRQIDAVKAPPPPSTQSEKARDSHPSSQKPAGHPMSPGRPLKSNGKSKPNEQVERSPERTVASSRPTGVAGAEEDGSSSSSYKSLRLTFYRLLKHYEFVCARLERYKSDRSAVGNVEEVEELVVEVRGLEMELDRIRNRLVRNYA